MTRLAKLFVYLNLFLAFALFSWGLALYTNRVNWLDTKSEAGTVPGQISQSQARISQLLKVIDESETGPAGYGPRRVQLAGVEARRDARQVGYRNRLAQARSGKFRVQENEDRGQSVFTDLTREGPDMMGPDKKPLEGLKTLQDRFAAETRAIEQLKIGKGILEDARWQEVRNGTQSVEQLTALLPTLGISDLNRLHTELSDLIRRDDLALNKQKEVRANLSGEERFLTAQKTNWLAELATLDLRRGQLEARIQSLQTLKKASR